MAQGRARARHYASPADGPSRRHNATVHPSSSPAAPTAAGRLCTAPSHDPDAAHPYGPLTVGGLVQQLRRFDPDMRVIMPGDIEDWTDVHEAHLDIFAPQRRHPQLLELADDGDPRAILVVRLFGAPDVD